MPRTFLIATVAALAISAPAQAERDRDDREERSQRAERSAKGQQQAEERRAPRQQQAAEQRASRQSASAERRTAVQQQVSERRERRQELAGERRARAQQMAESRGQSEQMASDRRARAQQIASDRRSRVEQRASDRQSRLQQQASDRRSRLQQETSDRRSRLQQQRSDRRPNIIERRGQLREQLIERNDDDSARPRAERVTRQRHQAWEQRGERLRLLAERREKLRDSVRRDDDDGRARQHFFRVGEQVNRNWWPDDHVPLSYAARYADDEDFYYRYDGDYLYQLRRDDDVVTRLLPLLGGAYSVGRPLPFFNTSQYNVPYGYNSLYYDRPDSYYRYGGGAIYQVDPTTQLISGIVALLTGQSLGIGQQLPLGYDVYNVPYAYRDRYYDTDDAWYRYDDGYIYGFDPRSRMINSMVPVYGGYSVGNSWPSYAGYDYDVPGYYDDLYYADSGYDYRYASGGIYQVDPKTQLVAALVALVTGQNFAVGQQMPMGYDAYNVPDAFRDRYYDTDQYNYRYADGHIYQVDARTQLIKAVIDAIV